MKEKKRRKKAVDGEKDEDGRSERTKREKKRNTNDQVVECICMCFFVWVWVLMWSNPLSCMCIMNCKCALFWPTFSLCHPIPLTPSQEPPHCHSNQPRLVTWWQCSLLVCTATHQLPSTPQHHHHAHKTKNWETELTNVPSRPDANWIKRLH